MKDNKTLSPDAIAIQHWLVSKLAERLKLSSESIDPHQTFVHYSLGSLAAVELSDELGEWLGRAVSPTLIYDYPSPDALACHLAREQTNRQVTPEAGSPSSEVADEGIAVIGMGCRFPGAPGPEAFWELLRDGIDAITEVPLDRWDIDSYYDPTAGTPGKMSTRWGGFLEAVDVFDHEFFSISPLEAASMDPQQRLLLEVGWESLEHAGLVPKSLAGTSTGVFIGISGSDYARLHAEANAYAGTGNALSIAANRLSYLLDLRGPSWAVDTACSSSLVAVHQACQSLRNRECSLALAGGVNLILAPQVTIAFSQAQMMAADGRCKTFDAAADGYVRSEGCGVVVLKRLADAQRDGDSILAVIRGSAVNHDGGSNGLTAPSGPAQQEVIHQALAAAELSPEQVSYIEAHGTGTLLGDPIEVQALGAVFAPDRSPEHPLLLGSVKANIGHLEAAAGIAGLIKTVLALQHQLIPSQLHFDTPNPHIAWQGLSLCVPTDSYSWPRNETPRFAGVSSFGFGGTNAHVIVEQAPTGVTQSPPLPLPQLLFLSAKTPDALRALAQRYGDDLETLPEEHLAPLCVASRTQRTHFSERLAVVASSIEQLRQQLSAFINDETSKEVSTGRVIPWQPLSLVFLFTGQGSQYVGMGRELYESEPVFRAALEQCAQLMDPHLEQPLLTLLYSADLHNESLQQTACAQPILFAVQYALVELWQSWGIRPAAVFGHSIGEFAAACAAGVLSLEDAVLLVLHRSRLMQALPANGKMAVIFAPALQVAVELKTIPEQITIAAFNSPTQTVLSGDSEAVLSACAHFENLGFSTQQLAVSHAFHSPLISPVMEKLEPLVRSVTLKTPEVRFVSSVSGKFVTTELTEPDYWLQQVIQPVCFAEGMATLQNEGFRAFLEIGPKATLLALGRACLAEDYEAAWLASLRPGQPERHQILQSLAELYVRGASVGGSEQSRTHACSWMKLPTYPFQGKRHWSIAKQVEKSRDGLRLGNTPAHALLGHKLQMADSNEIRFEVRLSGAETTFLEDHYVGKQSVFPATGYLEIALAAATSVSPNARVQVEQIQFYQPLLLDPEQCPVMQTVLIPNGIDRFAFNIFSCAESSYPDAQWVMRSCGIIQVNIPLDHTAINVEIDPSGDSRDVEEIYQNLAELGLPYGPSFRTLCQLQKLNEQEISARVELPKSLVEQPHGYLLHPALMDGCLQALAVAFENTSSPKLHLPVSIEKLQWYRQSTSYLHVKLQWQLSKPNGDLKAQLLLFDDEGLVAQLIGVRLAPVERDEAKDSKEWLTQLLWEEEPNEGPEVVPITQRWLIFSDGVVGNHLAELLRSQGSECVLVQPGEKLESPDQYQYELSPGVSEQYELLLSELIGKNWRPQVVVNLWSLLSEPETDWFHQQQLVCGSLLHIVHAVSSNQIDARLCIVTRGSQACQSTIKSLEQSSIWGLCRALIPEHPELACVLVDLDAEEEVSISSEKLQMDLRRLGQENHIAYRQERRYVARLVRHQSSPLSVERATTSPTRLKLTNYGVLDDFVLEPFSRRLPDAGAVEICVKATGLNFRDVLHALGGLKDYLKQHGFSEATIPFGFECAGIVTAVGEGVHGVAVGERVMAALAIGSLASFVTVDAQHVIALPDGLGFEEGAALPTAFLTAWYGLEHLARIRPGDRILIHAAAGGVGQAAVQIAKHAGAEIFASASPSKWEFLRSQGIQHVMNSRTLDFAQQILEITDGAGIDIILNSLNGEFIPQSLTVLSPGGRFIEIGKLGIWTKEQVDRVREDIAYFSFDLSKVSVQQPALIPQMLSKIVAGLQDGSFQPLPVRTFPVEQVSDGFHYMAQAQQIGKVVITQPEIETTFGISRQGSYLITGGLGSLGLQLAQWLAAQGAKHLVLVSRSKPSEQALVQLHLLRQVGVQLLIVRTDISCPEQVKELFRTIEQQASPLRGIIHAAGVLDDVLIQHLDWLRLEQVMAAKAHGAWLLHEQSEQLSLDFFVLFSSMASLVGGVGQGGYAAANAYLDGLAHYRQQRGLPALSINWGPWSGSEMTARLNNQQREYWKHIGVDWILPEVGLELFGQMLQEQCPQIGVLPVRWEQFMQQFQNSDKPPFLKHFWNEVELPTETVATMRQQLMATAHYDRQELLLQHLKAQLARVLNLEKETYINPKQRLFELGLDSLSAMAMRNVLEKDLAVKLPVTLLFDYPTLEVLTTHLVKLVSPEMEATSAVLSPLARNEMDVHEQLLTKVEQTAAEGIDMDIAKELAMIELLIEETSK
jgi:acyl transferase domain-containing protein/acyl carrier protein